MKIMASLIFFMLSSAALAQKEPLKCRFTPAKIKKEVKNLTCGPTQATLDEQMDELIRLVKVEEAEKKAEDLRQLPDDFVENIYPFVKRQTPLEEESPTYLKNKIDQMKEDLQRSKSLKKNLESDLKNYDSFREAYEKEMVPAANKFKSNQLKFQNSGDYEGISKNLEQYLDLQDEFIKKHNLSKEMFFLFADILKRKMTPKEAIDQINEESAALGKALKETEEKYASFFNKQQKDGGVDKRIVVKKYMERFLENIKSNPEFRDCGLTDAEIFSVFLYTSTYYESINTMLRTGNVTAIESQKAYIDTLNSALSKLQGYEGYVKRGIYVEKSELKDYCEGCVVQMKGFTSTSTVGGFERDISFVVKSKNGVYIAPLSSVTTEEEVLFKPGSKFKVLKVKGNEYTLEEIEEKGKK